MDCLKASAQAAVDVEEGAGDKTGCFAGEEQYLPPLRAMMAFTRIWTLTHTAGIVFHEIGTLQRGRQSAQ